MSGHTERDFETAIGFKVPWFGLTSPTKRKVANIYHSAVRIGLKVMS